MLIIYLPKEAEKENEYIDINEWMSKMKFCWGVLYGHGFNIPSYKILVNFQGEKSNVTVKKSGNPPESSGQS